MEVDLTTGDVTVKGRGGVTVRRRDGSAEVVPAGQTTTLADLRAAARRADATGRPGTPAASPATGQHATGQDATGQDDVGTASQPFLEEVTQHEQAFAAAIAAGDADAATTAVLDLEQTIRAWEADTLTGDLRDRAVATLRGLVTRLGDAAGRGMVPERDVIGPYVDLLLDEREHARDAGDYATSDRIRAALVDQGLEVNDGPQQTTWQRQEPDA
jgi:cysteinyl-tRNA synthetase